MKYFSMFSGIGGFDLSLNRLGHECIGYSEIDKYAIQTYQKNFGTEVTNYGNATTIRTEELPDFDILVGGFPCQSFSIAGKRRGFEDTRGTMFFEIARILKAKKPTTCMLENVKGLVNHNKGETFRIILQTLAELGYDVEYQVLNSRNFGVPQNRERVFIIGHLGNRSQRKVFPIRTNAEEVSSLPSEEVREDLTINKVFTQERKEFREHSTEEESPCLKNRMGTGGNNVPMIQALRNLNRNGPTTSTERAFTVQTSQGGENGVWLDKKLRRLTPQECERLQSFPDGWTEGVSDTQRYKQLGNALTVNVVYEIAKGLIE